jgi:hypothetical protein
MCVGPKGTYLDDQLRLRLVYLLVRYGIRERFDDLLRLIGMRWWEIAR